MTGRAPSSTCATPPPPPPYISSILELATCQYEAIIQTAAICSQVPSTGISQTAGTTVIDGLCGGGIYDLTSISNADIIGRSNTSTNTDLWGVRPCGPLSATNCSSGTSVCQIGGNYPVARYNPALQITLWQYGGPGVLSEISQNGDSGCTNQHRFANVTYVCNAAATTPIFISASEPVSCHYFLVIQTAAVCGVAFSVTLPAPVVYSSSSTGVAGPVLTSCQYAGYDLTSISGQDILFTSAPYAWAIRPCGVVTTPGYCNGEFCQSNTVISNNNFTARGVNVGPLWAQIQLNGQNGVAQYLQDGDACGDPNGDREGTIVYLCNQTATTPFIQSIQELTTCHYQAIIQTAAICAQVPTAGVSHNPGTPIISTQCGGGIYNLSTINGADIVGKSNTSTNGDRWAIRPLRCPGRPQLHHRHLRLPDW